MTDLPIRRDDLWFAVKSAPPTGRACATCIVPAIVLGTLLFGCGRSSNEAPAPRANAGSRIAATPASQLGPPRGYTPTGRLVADSGFRPQDDGFSFENYGAGFQELTAAQMLDLFGPEVCLNGSAANCELTPPAQIWMADKNEAIQGGHCLGFSITSLMMFEKKLDPLQFGAPSPSAMILVGNLAIQERIAESSVLQFSPRIQHALIPRAPKAVLDFLTAALNRSSTYTLGIFNPVRHEGHAVTPYAIEDKGDGRFAVLLYDNNYTNITRALTIDTNQNTWSYEASPTPSVESHLYQGKGTKNRIVLIPTHAGIGLQPCPFCSKASAPGFSARGASAAPSRSEFEEVSLAGDSVNHGHLVISDDAGHKTGFVNGRLVNQIPGAQVMDPLLNQNFRERPEPLYRIPRQVKFTVALDGSALSAPDLESVTIIGPGFGAVASNIDLRPGQRQQIQLTGNGTVLSYRNGAGAAQEPHLQIGLDRAGSDYQFSVTTPSLEPGSEITTLAQPASGQLTVNASAVRGTGKYSLAVTKLRRSGAQPARGRTVHIRGGGSARLALDH